ncbi:MAG: hypothetical protein L0271_25500 [Gemmatimonadetes bacterium]|nr:hypothetical protein [Gemmatimonadota bacterium]
MELGLSDEEGAFLLVIVADHQPEKLATSQSGGVEENEREMEGLAPKRGLDSRA